MEISLDRLCLGKWGMVVSINTEREMRQRLGDFGFIPGTRVCKKFYSPRKDVTAICFRGSVLALRTRDLKHILVQI